MSPELPCQGTGDTRKHSSGYWIKIHPTSNHLRNLITSAEKSLRTSRGISTFIPPSDAVAKSESDHSNPDLISAPQHQGKNLQMFVCFPVAAVSHKHQSKESLIFN